MPGWTSAQGRNGVRWLAEGWEDPDPHTGLHSSNTWGLWGPAAAQECAFHSFQLSPPLPRSQTWPQEGPFSPWR